MSWVKPSRYYPMSIFLFLKEGIGNLVCEHTSVLVTGIHFQLSPLWLIQPDLGCNFNYGSHIAPNDFRSMKWWKQYCVCFNYLSNGTLSTWCNLVGDSKRIFYTCTPPPPKSTHPPKIQWVSYLLKRKRCMVRGLYGAFDASMSPLKDTLFVIPIFPFMLSICRSLLLDPMHRLTSLLCQGPRGSGESIDWQAAIHQICHVEANMATITLLLLIFVFSTHPPFRYLGKLREPLEIASNIV